VDGSDNIYSADITFASQASGDRWATASGQAIDVVLAGLARGQFSGETASWAALFYIHEDGPFGLWESAALV
jgi:hypothetical protein